METMIVFRDPHILNPQFIVGEIAISIPQTCLSLPDGFDLRAFQLQAGDEFFKDFIIEPGLLVFYVDPVFHIKVPACKVNTKFCELYPMHQRPRSYNLVAVVGHTAGGKTRLAACLADRIGGEVISADSRQVYRRMDLGTGKDYSDYVVDGRKVKYHLVDILEPGCEYNVYEFQKDFLRVYGDILDRQAKAVLCGGSGLYIEAVLRGYRLIRVPVNPSLRKDLSGKTMEELTRLLAGFKTLHNKTDTENRKRLIRALEIEHYYRDHPHLDDEYPDLHPLILGVRYDREKRRERITKRLKERLAGGMVEEVEGLIREGVPVAKLIYYGLEYKYITEYLTGNLEYGAMVDALETAIHRFAKRQMTWFRGMERRGLKIHWLEGEYPLSEKLSGAMELYSAEFKNPTAPGSA
jgi:tRNA dimethylallyltransferase